MAMPDARTERYSRHGRRAASGLSFDGTRPRHFSEMGRPFSDWAARCGRRVSSAPRRWGHGTVRGWNSDRHRLGGIGTIGASGFEVGGPAGRWNLRYG